MLQLHVSCYLDGQYSSVDVYTSSLIRVVVIQHLICFLLLFYQCYCNVWHIQYAVAMFAMLRKDCHCSALFCDATFFASVLEGCINHIACSCACVKCCFLRKIHMYYILSDSIYSASITCLLQEFCFLCIYQLY